jgi:hypothetical protein
MAAEPKCGVQAGFAWLWIKDTEDFFDADRYVHAGGSTTPRNNMFHVCGVFVGIKFFIFIFKTAGIPATVADTAFMWFWRFRRALWSLLVLGHGGGGSVFVYRNFRKAEKMRDKAKTY